VVQLELGKTDRENERDQDFKEVEETEEIIPEFPESP